MGKPAPVGGWEKMMNWGKTKSKKKIFVNHWAWRLERKQIPKEVFCYIGGDETQLLCLEQKERYGSSYLFPLQEQHLN